MTEESDNATVADILASVLPIIDKGLAAQQILVEMRPLHAAVQFCRDFVLEVRVDGREWTPDLENLDFLTEKWFRGIYHLTEEWYERRYGQALKTKAQHHALAFVLAYGIPLRINVPLSTKTSGERPKTMWLSFPDALLPDEEPLEWISAPPNLVEMESKEKGRLLRDVKQVCNYLRSISSHEMGITGLTAEGRGLVSTARGHLDTAARQVLEHWQKTGTAKAAWELQVACESTLKAVAETKTGSFRASHDLFVLFDDAAPYLNHFPRHEIKKMPRWEKMIDYRYAQGKPPRLEEVFRYYLSALRVVDGCFRDLATLILGKGSFLIGLPPWRQPIEESGSEGGSQDSEDRSPE